MNNVVKSFTTGVKAVFVRLASNHEDKEVVMKRFKIKELESFSGIKAHTIRIWEKRYAIFNPERSPGNKRFYSHEDVQRLLYISLLLTGNNKISKLVKLELTQLIVKVEAFDSEEADFSRAINDLIILMHLSEIEEFEDVLDSTVLTLGIDVTLRKVIFPFLQRIRLFSYSNRSSNTHFVVTALRKKIIFAIETVKPPEATDKKALFFLSENEHFDLLLLFVSYLLKSRGIGILYLGTNISTENLEHVVVDKKPDLHVTHIPGKQDSQLDTVLSFISSTLPRSKLYALTSESIASSTEEPNLEIVHYQDVLEKFEDSISNK